MCVFDTADDFIHKAFINNHLDIILSAHLSQFEFHAVNKAPFNEENMTLPLYYTCSFIVCYEDLQENNFAVSELHKGVSQTLTMHRCLYNVHARNK